MSYLDNIKAIATELASMSPRTQIELVKLCKDLCIQTKNYLVAFDETTLPALDARIEALETLTNNLSSELDTAEGNIQANANAIATIQDTITTIQTALSNVYTKTQIDTMLASYYTKSDINTMFGTYYTKGEVNTLLSAKANANDVYTKTEVNNALADKADKSTTYTKTEVDTALSGKASLSSNNTFSGENAFNESVEFNDTTDFYANADFNGNDVQFEEPSYIKFSSNNNNLQDELNARQNKLYKHQISIMADYEATDGNYASVCIEIINTRSTQMTTASDIAGIYGCYNNGDDTNTYNGDLALWFYLSINSSTVNFYGMSNNSVINFYEEISNLDDFSITDIVIAL